MARLITHASNDERISSDHADVRIHRADRPTPSRARSRSAAPIVCSAATDVEVRAGKTGFISKAGYCLATLLRLPQSGQQVAVVVLGARSSAGRFVETRNLFEWLSVKTSALFSAASSPATPAPVAAAQPQLQ